MKVIVAGTVRVPPAKVAAFRPHMQAMIAASRAEDGCEAYDYGEDVSEAGLMRVFEVWRDWSALNAHFKTPHLAAWRDAWPAFGVTDRRLAVYEIAGQSPL
ncbi:MAG TPA: putative quinol monooxygenase [Caulobacteraceae bacterium]|jgi:quinol monooxygenase YgiN